MLTNSEKTVRSERDYQEAFTRCDNALKEYESGLDELGEACDAVTADDVEHAVSVVDSAAGTLFETAEALVNARCELESSRDDELVGLNLETLAANKRCAHDACAEIAVLLKETPSDGEQLEEQVEKLVEVATALYENLGEIL